LRRFLLADFSGRPPESAFCPPPLNAAFARLLPDFLQPPVNIPIRFDALR
jgi:hypothetical protein